MSQEVVFEILKLSIKLLENETVALVSESNSTSTKLLSSILASKQTSKETYRQFQYLPANPRDGFYSLLPVEEQLYATSNLLQVRPPLPEIKAFVAQALKAVDIEPASILGKFSHEIPMQSLLRLHFARIFLIRPKVLILQDPFPFIPLGAQSDLLAFIIDFQRKAKLSILLFSNDISLAGKLGNHIYILGDSSVIEHGTPDEVLHRPQHAFTQRLLAQNIHLYRRPCAHL